MKHSDRWRCLRGTEDLGKLFVRSDLCGTFTSLRLDARCPPNNLEKNNVIKQCAWNDGKRANCDRLQAATTSGPPHTTTWRAQTTALLGMSSVFIFFKFQQGFTNHRPWCQLEPKEMERRRGQGYSLFFISRLPSGSSLGVLIFLSFFFYC